MPKYIYKCSNCGDVSEKNHSMSEKLTDCELCDTLGSLKKIPAAIAVQYKDKTTGKIVDEHIREAKEELAAEKQKLTTQDYEQ